MHPYSKLNESMQPENFGCEPRIELGKRRANLSIGPLPKFAGCKWDEEYYG